MIYYYPQHNMHNPKHEFTGTGLRAYPESPKRVERIIDHLGDDYSIQPVKLTHLDPIYRVHAQDYVDFLQGIPTGIDEISPTSFAMASSSRRPENFYGQLGFYMFDPATPLTSTSFDAIHGAASVALEVSQQVADRTFALGLCRPPGHHASYRHGGGYCYLNNMAIAAQNLTERGLSVTILDLDFHHGNGTQSIFFSRDDVNYVSIHGDPELCYPFYWGYADEIGSGLGSGHTRNFPVNPLKMDGDTYLEILGTACDVVEQYSSDVVMLSMGFDCHINDPIAGMKLQTTDYQSIGQQLQQFDLLGILLEGGYALTDIGPSMAALLDGLGVNE